MLEEAADDDVSEGPGEKSSALGAAGDGTGRCCVGSGYPRELAARSKRGLGGGVPWSVGNSKWRTMVAVLAGWSGGGSEAVVEHGGCCELGLTTLIRQ